MYQELLRPWLFRMDPEDAHHRALSALEFAARHAVLRRWLSRAFAANDASLESRVAGIKFPNPVGLAAGFDKDCRLAGALPLLGFGFIECGTVTLRAQPGNPKPRMHRVPEVEGLINRLGFNNPGAAAAARNLALSGPRLVPVGVNIGLNKDAAPEDAPAEYAAALAAVQSQGDYFTINVSSPNTPGLRRLQEKLKLEKILLALPARNPARKPVFVKLSPDLEDSELGDLLPLLEKHSAGVICANTTLSRAGLPEYAANLQGGLSGAPVRDPATRMIRQVYCRTEGRLPIIGVGGVSCAEDAWQKIRAGASLVQVYTGLIYKGPGLVREINDGLARLMRENGVRTLSDAVGKSHPEIAKVK